MKERVLLFIIIIIIIIIIVSSGVPPISTYEKMVGGWMDVCSGMPQIHETYLYYQTM